MQVHYPIDGLHFHITITANLFRILCTKFYQNWSNFLEGSKNKVGVFYLVHNVYVEYIGHMSHMFHT